MASPSNSSQNGGVIGVNNAFTPASCTPIAANIVAVTATGCYSKPASHPGAGAVMLVAVPPTVVIVVDAENVVVLAGASHTLFVASPELTMVMETPPFAVTSDGKTVFWLVGAIKSFKSILAPVIPFKSVAVLLEL